MKKPVGRPKKVIDQKVPTEQVVESPAIPVSETVEPDPIIRAVQERTMVYSEQADKPPIIIEAGAIIPDGYMLAAERTRFVWEMDSKGAWTYTGE